MLDARCSSGHVVNVNSFLFSPTLFFPYLKESDWAMSEDWPWTGFGGRLIESGESSYPGTLIIHLPWGLGQVGGVSVSAKVQGGYWWILWGFASPGGPPRVSSEAWLLSGVFWGQQHLVAGWTVTRLQASGEANRSICVSPAKQQGY